MSTQTNDRKIKQFERNLKLLCKANREFHASGYDPDLLHNIAVPLRALLEGKKSLMIRLAKKYRVPLEFYSNKEKKADEEFGVIEIVACKTWSVYPNKNLKKYTLNDWLITPSYAFYINGKNEIMTPYKILKSFTDKEVVHCDNYPAKEIEHMQRISSSHNLDGVGFFFLNLVPLIVWLANKIKIHYLYLPLGRGDVIRNECKKQDQYFNTVVNMPGPNFTLQMLTEPQTEKEKDVVDGEVEEK